MKVGLLVGDSYMAYLLARRLFDSEQHTVEMVVLSTRYRNSPLRILRAARGKSVRWFGYRMFVQMKSVVLGVLRNASVAGLAQAHGVSLYRTEKIALTLQTRVGHACDIAVAVNFDQLLGVKELSTFPHGVCNVHASKLPADRGVSPALWAFARGDASAWFSVYRIDEGLDTGPLYLQDEVPIGDVSAVKAYESVCDTAGHALLGVLDSIADGTAVACAQEPNDGSYNGIPDALFDKMMRTSRRKLVARDDLLDFFRMPRSEDGGGIRRGKPRSEQNLL